ncbi:MAG: hypothetical protein AB7O57_01940 [Hyphomicrobiaceae bacterium]
MTIGRVVKAAMAAVLVAAGAATVSAQGLEGLHDKVRHGNKLCFSDHFHFGNSSGAKSRKDAQNEAIKSWESFTGWEYGAAWGSFRLAEGRGIKCEQSGGSWGCSVQARACRR